jgi:hypothetical protein
VRGLRQGLPLGSEVALALSSCGIAPAAAFTPASTLPVGFSYVSQRTRLFARLHVEKMRAF